MLLAGGRSTRMGRDKAGVLIEGRTLWQLQVAKLKSLHPRELFISGRPDGPYAGAGIEIVTDENPGLGPLAGIAATMRRMSSPLLLVLAIDLPALSSSLLAALVREAAARQRGIVPLRKDRFEPLAALYPASALGLAEECLHGADRSMQAFARRAIEAGMAAAFPVMPAQWAEFKNVNTPADL